MAVQQPNRKTECWWWLERSSFRGIRLDMLCLQALTKQVVKAVHGNGRNTRKRKSLREHLSYSLPVELQERLLEEAANSEDADMMLSLYSLFQPVQKLPAKNVDLCGKQRYSFNLELTRRDGTLTDRWYPYYPFDPLTADQLTSLYNYLLRSKGIKQLEGISFAAKANALKKTNLPNLLARANSLTRVVILEGADNHSLRILGLNCPSLKHLDVSHSWSVNDAGLKNLLLKRIPRVRITRRPMRMMDSILSFVFGLRFPQFAVRGNFPNIPRLEKNACAATLDVLILSGTKVSWQGCDFACQCMPKSYLYVMRPLLKVARMKMKECAMTNNDPRRQIEDAIRAMDSPRFRNAALLVEQYKPQPRSSYGSTMRSAAEGNPVSFVLVHHQQSFCDSFVCLAMKLEGTQVTSLTLPFNSLGWYMLGQDHDDRLPLRTLANRFPNLVCFRGCLKGVWNEDPLVNRQMIHLKKVYAWGVFSTTAISILRHCSSLTMLEYNHLNLWELDTNSDNTDNDQVNGEPAPRLSLAALERCFQENPSLKDNLAEIILRPARNLGPRSLTILAENCRNLRRIGDLHAWNITKADIKRISRELVENGHILPTFSLFNIPPSDSATKEWDSWMSFD